MSQPIDIRPDHLRIVQKILNAHIPNHTVWVFGSRAKWTTKDFSDLDLCVKGKEPLSFATLAHLRDDFSESDLPYKVDIVDWYGISESFRKIIDQDKIVLPQAQYLEWQKVKLGDFIEIKHGFAFKSDFFVEKETQNVLLTPGNFQIGGGFKKDKLKFYDGFVPEDYILKAEDIIITMTDLSKQGDTLGYPAYVPESTHFNFLHNQRLGRVVFKSNAIVKSYLYYLLCSKGYRDEILAGASGTSIKHTAPKRIESFTFYIPSVSEQKAIGDILSSLDQKIELNCQMNETLEATARALFKSWFVDFDPVRAKMEGRQPEGLTLELAEIFPDKFVDSSLGKIPKGWQVKQLDRIIELIGGGTPNTGISEYWDGDIPWFTVVDAPNESDVFVIDTEKKISKLGLDKSSTKILFAGTTIITARGTVGKVALVGVPMAMNQSCYGIRSINDDSYWTYFQICRVVSELQKLAHGSIFDTITRATFSSIPVICPPPSLIRAFDMLVTPLLERIRLNIFNKLKVMKIRDNLLPKLMSGALRVNNFHEVVNG